MKRPLNAYPDRTTLLATIHNMMFLSGPSTAPPEQQRNTLWLRPEQQEFVIHHDDRTVEQRSYTHNYRIVSRR